LSLGGARDHDLDVEELGYTVPEQQGDVPQEADKPLSAPAKALSRTERLLAGGTGGVFGALGSVAVFATTNQVAAVAMLLPASAFLLVAIQGTPVTRASKEGFELRSIDRAVEESRKTIEETKGPEQAFYFTEGAATAKPKIRSRESIVHGLAVSYESWVLGELAQVVDELGLKLLREPPISDSRVDAIVVKDGAVLATVEVKYRPDGYIASQNFLSSTKGIEGSMVFVCNVPFSNEVKRFASLLSRGNRRIHLIKWAPDDDKEELRAAVVHALGSSAPPPLP
jgi:hypothetical protein